MPPKTCTCAVCGETVLKAQTVAISDGKRVCKTHDEANQAGDFQDKQKAILERTRVKKKRFNDGFPSMQSMEEMRIQAQETCWCCAAKGYRIDEWIHMNLEAHINIQALELIGMEKSAAINTVLDITGLRNREALYIINDVSWIASKIRPEFKSTANFGNVGSFCLSCIDKLGLTRQYKHQYPSPKFTPELMGCMAVINDEMVKERKEQLVSAMEYFSKQVA